jgi:lipid A 3-O-deacylase
MINLVGIKLRISIMRPILFVCFLFPIVAFAQDRLLRLNYDNDYFSATDRYYTQGVRLEWIAPVFLKSPVNGVLLRNKKATKRYSGIALQRDGFTAQGIQIDTIPVGNRPYAATMFLSNFSIELNRESRTKLYSQFDIGMMGPIVGGNEEQTAIHRSIGDVLPQGWKYQMSNSVIVNYTSQFEKGFINQTYFNAVGIGQARVGTLYTDGSVGAMLRAGLMNGYFENLGITRETTARKFQVYGYAKGLGKVVGYNATLQGGMFTDNSYTIENAQINRVVGQIFYGIVISYKRFQLEYGKVNITKEFKSGLTHGWGHCNISFCF